MKYIKLFEAFNISFISKPHDPYELMIIPPNKKTKMIMNECRNNEPNLNLVSDLIALGANLDWQDEDKHSWTALHVAIWYNSPQIARMLIDAKAKLDIQDEYTRVALHMATLSDRPEIVRMLIDAKADLDIQDKDGWTALHFAANDVNFKIVEMLVDAGARKNIRNNEGNLPHDFVGHLSKHGVPEELIDILR